MDSSSRARSLPRSASSPTRSRSSGRLAIHCVCEAPSVSSWVTPVAELTGNSLPLGGDSRTHEGSFRPCYLQDRSNQQRDKRRVEEDVATVEQLGELRWKECVVDEGSRCDDRRVAEPVNELIIEGGEASGTRVAASA